MLEVTARRGAYVSPLRYPGGKASLAGFFEVAIGKLGLHKPTYVEPYAGGAGAGIELLLKGVVGKIVINDFDPAIYACWKSLVTEPDDFIRLLETTPITVEEWVRQREIYRRRFDPGVGLLSLGFATFYLNRTSRSGVLGAGVIGGYAQNGAYRVGARFNKESLRERIEKIASVKARIRVTRQDGANRLREYLPKENVFAYVDPPYVQKGSSLYMSSFQEQDHLDLALVLNGNASTNWILTYDIDNLVRRLYRAREISEYGLLYSAHLKGPREQLKRPKARELMVVSDRVAGALA